MPRRLPPLLVALAVAGGCVSSARAEDARPTTLTPEAAAHKARGDEAMQAGNNRDALAAYRLALQTSADPALSFNVGRAHFGLGHYAEALRWFEAFERDASDEVKARAPGLVALREDLLKRTGHIAVNGPAGASVFVRGESWGLLPIATPPRVDAGDAVVDVVHPSFLPFRSTVTVPSGSAIVLDVTLQPRATRGSLSVSAKPSSGHIVIDGRTIASGLAEMTLDAGTHVIALSADGYEDAEHRIELHAGEQRRLDVVLEPKRSVLTRWWFWASAGVVAVGAVTTVYVLSTEKNVREGDISPGKLPAVLSF